MRLVLVTIDVWRPDRRAVAEGVDEGESGGALGWRSWDGGGDPGVGCVVSDLGRGRIEGLHLLVPFMAKTKHIRKREKYLGPKLSVNMKIRNPTMETCVEDSAKGKSG